MTRDSLFDAQIDAEAWLRGRGWPEAQVFLRTVPSRKAGRVDVEAHLDPGPRVTVEFEGDPLPAASRRAVADLYRTGVLEPSALEEMRPRGATGAARPRAPRATGGGDRLRRAGRPSRRRLRVGRPTGRHRRDHLPGCLPPGGGFARPALRNSPDASRAGGRPPERRTGVSCRRCASLGYPNGTIVRRELSADGRTLTVEVDPSLPSLVDSVEVRGVPDEEARDLARRVLLSPGEPADADKAVALGPRHGGRSSRARFCRGPRPGGALPRHARGPAPRRRRLRRRGRPRRARRDRLPRGALTHERALGPARRGARARGSLPAGRPRPGAGGRLRPGSLREREGDERVAIGTAPSTSSSRRRNARRSRSATASAGRATRGSPPSSTSSTAISSAAASRSACAASTIRTTGPSGRSGAFPRCSSGSASTGGTSGAGRGARASSATGRPTRARPPCSFRGLSPRVSPPGCTGGIGRPASSRTTLSFLST